MNVQVVGCSHHDTSIAIRERLSFRPEQAEEALDHWRRVFKKTEAVLLSTCNRVEIYAAGEAAVAPSREQVAGFLARFHRIDPAEISPHLYHLVGESAVRHLFTVAASLDSMVVGEPQILAQVKQAYQAAVQHDNAGPLLHSAFQAAIRVARRVAAETAIHQRRVSVPSVAVADFARQIFERFDDKKTLVVGAGEMAAETLRYLTDEGAKDITVVNRRFRSRRSTGQAVGRRARPWEELPEAIAAADMVISTTGAAEPIVTLGNVSADRSPPRGAAAPGARSGRAARLRSSHRQAARRLPLFDRRPASRLPGKPRQARQGAPRRYADHRTGVVAVHGRPLPSRHRSGDPTASRRLEKAEGGRVAAAVEQAAGAQPARPRGGPPFV